MGDKRQSTIKLTRFQVPSLVKAGDLRRLSCQYELEQATLHAMKLFKDNKEVSRLVLVLGRLLISTRETLCIVNDDDDHYFATHYQLLIARDNL